MLQILKKFDQKQLENRPLIWSTRFYPLLFISLAIWIFSFLIGFITLTPKSILDHDYHNHFFTSFYNWFYIIVVIIVITLWAVQFYKHNAFTRFYPLKKFHFQKKFLLIFFPFLLLLTGYYPFTYGAKLKTSFILDETELTKDFFELNKASAFLPFERNPYKLENRVYPAPFPCSINTYDNKEKEWETRWVYRPLTMDDEGNILTVRSVDWDEEKFSILEDEKLLFYSSEEKSVDGNTCEPKNILKKIHSVDPLEFSLAYSSVLNFSDLLVRTNDGSYFDPKAENYYDFVLQKHRIIDFQGHVFLEHYAKGTHEIVRKKDFKRLQNQLEKTIQILTKYQIDHDLNVRSLLKYFKQKNFENIYPIIHENANYLSLEECLDREAFDMAEYNALPFDEQLEIYSPMYIDRRELNYLQINLHKSTHNSGMAKFAPGILVFTFGITFLFFLLSVVKLKFFFISIPVWGVLMILIGVLIGSLLRGSENLEFIVPSIFLFALIMVVAINWWFLRDPKISLKPLHVSLPMALLAIPVIPGIFLMLMHLSTKSELEVNCGSYTYTEQYVYQYWMNGALIHPYTLFAFGFIASLCSFYILRVYRSKPE